MTEETVNVNPDGSTTFDDGGAAGADGESTSEGDFDEEMMEEVVKGIDPAIYLLIAVILGGFIYFLYVRKSREEDEYFSNYGKVRLYSLIMTTETIELTRGENLRTICSFPSFRYSHIISSFYLF